jgi:hypothetical protein
MAKGLTRVEDAAFDPEATRRMGEAFDLACGSISNGGQIDVVKEVIAKRIIKVAHKGERDPVALCERALQELGIAPKGDDLISG